MANTAPPGAGRSTAPTSRPGSTRSPVSSCTSRTTASRSLSPGLTRPPGSDQRPVSGSCPRLTSSSRPVSSVTMAPTHLILGTGMNPSIVLSPWGYLTCARGAVNVGVHEDGSHLPALRRASERAERVVQRLAVPVARRGVPAAAVPSGAGGPEGPAARRRAAGLAAVAAAGRLAGDRLRWRRGRQRRDAGLRGRAVRAQPGGRAGRDAGGLGGDGGGPRRLAGGPARARSRRGLRDRGAARLRPLPPS